MFNIIKKHFYLNFDFSTIVLILFSVLALPFISFLPEKYGYENGLIENIQMLVLFIAFGIALKAKELKKLYFFVALFISILILREVNCGRTLFFARPEMENAFYQWKELKYGYLAHPIFGFYIVMVLFYFVKNKLFLDLFQLIKKFRFPLVSIIFFLCSAIGGYYAERYLHNLVIEEFAELLVYLFFTQILWLYSRQKIKTIS